MHNVWQVKCLMSSFFLFTSSTWNIQYHVQLQFGFSFNLKWKKRHKIHTKKKPNIFIFIKFRAYNEKMQVYSGNEPNQLKYQTQFQAWLWFTAWHQPISGIVSMSKYLISTPKLNACFNHWRFMLNEIEILIHAQGIRSFRFEIEVKSNWHSLVPQRKYAFQRGNQIKSVVFSAQKCKWYFVWETHIEEHTMQQTNRICKSFKQTNISTSGFRSNVTSKYCPNYE